MGDLNKYDLGFMKTGLSVIWLQLPFFCSSLKFAVESLVGLFAALLGN
jgi:hypothetical protein